MKEILDRLKEVFLSVFPIVVIVYAIHFLFVPLSTDQLWQFSIGAVLILIGLTIFLFGVDQSIDPICKTIGRNLFATRVLAIVITVSLILGFFVSVAEPDLHILANQVEAVTQGQFSSLLMVVVVSIGIGVMMTLGLLRITYSIRLKWVFLIAYGIIFVLAIFSSPEFLAIAFDSSGATTGAITVPFILALAGSVSSMKKDSKSAEVDSFGLIGIASSGVIISVLATGLIMGVENINGDLPETVEKSSGVIGGFIEILPQMLLENLLSLGPIVIAYLIFFALDKNKKMKNFWGVIRGVVVTYVGLVLFLLGVNGGFMEIGSYLGQGMAQLDSKIPVLVIAFIMGLLTVLAEPAVYSLTHQVESVTGGYVRRPLVLIFLSLAVGLALFMSVLRIFVDDISLWMYLLPGFGISVLASFFVPELFVGIAFDAGGVASGPMTATFALAFLQGIAAVTPGADVVIDGFGMISVVAMVPILSIQILGLIYKNKIAKLES